MIRDRQQRRVALSLAAARRMSSFPLRDWQVQPSDEYELYSLDSTPSLSVAVCAKIGSDGSFNGQYRIVVGGNILINFFIPIASLLPAISGISGSLHIAIQPSSASPRAGCATSGWADLETLLKSRDILLVDNSTALLDPAPLLAQLRSDCNEKEAVGASIRYAVTGTAEGNIALELQGLPLPAKFLKPLHYNDNVATILLASQVAASDLFDGVTHSGPVPVFFGADPSTAAAALCDDPAKVYEHIAQLSSVFLLAEHLSPDAAASAVKKKARAGTGKPAFSAILRPFKKTRMPDPDPHSSLSDQQLRIETGTGIIKS